MERRKFLKQLAAGTLLFTPLGTQLLQAQAAPGRPGKKLLVIFQRGACDGLSVIPPVEDAHYHNLRPSIAIAKKHCLPLSGPFGLHPALRALEAAWKEKDLLFVHQFGSPHASRSHFDAQDFMETGTPGLKSTVDGFLSRAIVEMSGTPDPLRAVAIQSNLPRLLQGEANAVAMRSLKDFQGGNKLAAGILSFEALYAGAVDQAFRGVGEEAFTSLRRVREKTGAEEFSFPKGDLPKKLQEVAALFTSGLGTSVAVTETGGWDTHAGQGAAEGNLSRRLLELGGGLAAFRDAMISRKLWGDILVLVITEFGRTAKENGTRGTDHGHGSVAFAMGGSLRARQKGGRVLHAWKGLQPEHLHEGRDLQVVHDFRDLLGEALTAQLGLKPKQLEAVFPGHKVQPIGLFT